ncbi:MAG: hypothetical protein U1E25_05675 [Methylocystis sp.]
MDVYVDQSAELSAQVFSQLLWPSRTRVYIGVQNILDPFRFVLELQDSRAYNSIYEYQGQEINQTELISGYGELFFRTFSARTISVRSAADAARRPISPRTARPPSDRRERVSQHHQYL